MAARKNAKIAKAIKRKEQNKGYGSFLDRKPYDRKAESRSSNSKTTMLNELDSTIQPGWYHVYILNSCFILKWLKYNPLTTERSARAINLSQKALNDHTLLIYISYIYLSIRIIYQFRLWEPCPFTDDQRIDRFEQYIPDWNWWLNLPI